jgi:predicted AlkP superfamily pyrophosphatase or phosphodiesterase
MPVLDRPRRWLALALPMAALATTGAKRVAPATAPAPPAPKLVVLITVDQMRADYLDRFASQYKYGLARLINGGAVYTYAFQDHANAETAPGHATVGSGREPYRTGIVLNAVGVPDAKAPLIGGGGPGASPFRFVGTTLFDWMKAKDSRSRALSVSRKDRGAILPIGKSKENVYWYAANGNFTTSKYYADELPQWVQAFNALHIPQSYAGKAWEPLLPVSSYPEPDTVVFEDLGREPAFPHRLSSDPVQAARDFIAFPWMDDVTVQFALAGVNALKLGQGPAPDLLAVSLSTTDAVGHRFGMSSREIHDQMLRVDRAIGTLLDSLYKIRDSSTIVVALTADHGVTMAPELAAEKDSNPMTGPIRADLSGLDKEFMGRLVAKGVDSSAFDFEDAMLFLDKQALAKAHLKPDSVARSFATEAKTQPGVFRADLFSEILHGDTTRDFITRRWRHAVPPTWPVAVVVTLKQGSVWGDYATGIHGSPYDDDTHVPLVFYGPGVAAGKHAEFARVVDLAPTLAALLGVKPTEEIDGHVLTDATK